jgi:hypothetical protein
MTYEAEIRLKPIQKSAVATVDGDDWLNNDNTELLNEISTTADTHINSIGQHYTVDSLLLNTRNTGIFLKTRQGDVELFTGDEISIAEQRYEVVINHQVKNTAKAAPINAAPVKAPSESLPMIGGDIWGSDEMLAPSVKVADPFVHTPRRHVQNNLPQAPQVQTRDPLNFLYDHTGSHDHNPNALLPSVSLTSSMLPANTTPNYFSENLREQSTSQLASPLPRAGYEGNVLNELGIHQTSVSDSLMQPTTNNFMDESPVDHLDEYLTIDDDRYEYSPSQAPMNYEDSSHSTNRENSALSSMRSLFKTRRSS